jgi:PKD repeat protein
MRYKMNGKYFGIIFAMILLLSVGTVTAALGQGSWIINGGKSLSIVRGESAEFGYSITAVTSMGGQYSIMLFREGSSTPIKTYTLNTPTIGNGAVGKYTVTVSDYSNLAGDYYILINSVDKIGADSYRLDLKVTNPIIPPLTITCTANPKDGNSPLNVQLIGQANGGTGTYTYTWTYGDGQTTQTTQNTATHTYNTGTYNPTLTVRDSENRIVTVNCGTIISRQIIPPITASCNVNPTSGTTPLNVQFTSNANGGTGTYTYTWTYGDGQTTQTTQNTATHTYNTGTYNALLRVRDSNNNEITVSCGAITVNPVIKPLSASCYANPTSGYAPLGVNLNAHVTGGNGQYTYTWAFGDGSSAQTSQNYISHIYNIGNYAPALTVRDSDNKAITVQCGNIVANQPIKPITITCSANPTSGNTPLSVAFTTQTSGGTGVYTYEWNFGDNTIVRNNNQNVLAYLYYNPGTYHPTVTVIDSNNNRASTSCGIINSIKPILPLTVTCSANPTSGNAPLNVQFTSNANGGTGTYTYTWTYGDGQTTQTSQNTATHLYTEGTFITNVKVTDTQGNSATVNCGTINAINPITPLTVACSVTPTSGTAPLTVQLSSQVTGGNGPYGYMWVYGDGIPGYTSQNAPTHTYNTAGTYNINLKVTDNRGISTTASCGTVTVNPIIIPPLEVACSVTPTSGTAPLTVQLSSQVTGGNGPYGYMWVYGDGIPGYTSQNAPTHTYNTAGTYNINLKVTDNRGISTTASCGTVTVNAKPIPPIEIDTINCFPRIADNNNQSCSVFLKPVNGQPVGNANINIYHIGGSLNGQLFGTCVTDRLSGGCEVQKEMRGIGTYTVYATASASGYISDTDTYPRYTFEVYAQRYNIINLGTYKDNKFFYPEDTFYRGQPLYAKFQVYDPITNTFVTSDIVTAASLVSLPGGRADMNRMTYSGNWYYYELNAIPLTHDFLGDSNVFAFAFNFTGLTAGQAQVDLTILNNLPVINNIPDMYITVGSTQYIDLDNYGSDLEDNMLIWNMFEDSAYFSANIQTGNVLSVSGIAQGTGIISLRGYDLDNDYASTTLTVHVLPIIIPEDLSVSCSATPLNGDAPLSVSFNAVVSHGTGNYDYIWSFGDNVNNVVSNSLNSMTHTYNSVGTYSATVVVTDRNTNKVASSNCGIIKVNNPIIPPGILDVSCVTLPNNGFIPLNAMFIVSVNNNTGPYTYTYNYGMGYTTTSQDNIAYQTYITPGVYNPSVHVTDAQGNFGDASCGLVVAKEDTNYTLVANAGGPYSGFINEAILFDASASYGSLGIVKYRWNFGDGTIIETITPTISHVYSKINVYTVTVTVFDSRGHSRTAQTTAKVIERSRYKDDILRDVPDKGLVIQQLTIYGEYGEVLQSNDDVTIYLRLKNEWDRKLENIRVTASIPEFGFESRSSITSIRKGGEETVMITMPVYDLPKGIHYVRITITNDDNGEQVRRIKWREVLVE